MCEAELARRTLSFIKTPDEATFERIPAVVAEHRQNPASRRGLPYANLIWMLFGFDLFRVLSAEGWGCLEVYPQATVRLLGAGGRHKTGRGVVLAQLAAAARHTRWPTPPSTEALRQVAFGSLHDALDAYLAAWVAALDEQDREPIGAPPADAIWIPKLTASSVHSARPR